MDVCPKCGLPEEACICEEIAKEKKQIKVTTEKRKFGKETTIISGLGKDVDLKDLASQLKSKMACGGTVKNGKIELQGDHRKKMRDALSKLGFKEEQINIK